jgi:hypothetical protein
MGRLFATAILKEPLSLYALQDAREHINRALEPLAASPYEHSASARANYHAVERVYCATITEDYISITFRPYYLIA